MFTDSNLSYLVAGLIIGIIITVAACWHEARKARAKGFREGFDACEFRYCDRIQTTIRQVRTECGLPADPPPPAPQPLIDDLMLRWAGPTQAEEQTSMNEHFANGGDFR